MRLRDKLLIAYIRFSDNHPLLVETARLTLLSAFIGASVVYGSVGVITLCLQIPHPSIRAVATWTLFGCSLIFIIEIIERLAKKLGYTTTQTF